MMMKKTRGYGELKTRMVATKLTDGDFQKLERLVERDASTKSSVVARLVRAEYDRVFNQNKEEEK
jgi:DNA polymerase III sliding clamp (beta) subunit (PCNA family)